MAADVGAAAAVEFPEAYPALVVAGENGRVADEDGRPHLAAAGVEAAHQGTAGPAAGPVGGQAASGLGGRRPPLVVLALVRRGQRQLTGRVHRAGRTQMMGFCFQQPQRRPGSSRAQRGKDLVYAAGAHRRVYPEWIVTDRGEACFIAPGEQCPWVVREQVGRGRERPAGRGVPVGPGVDGRHERREGGPEDGVAAGVEQGLVAEAPAVRAAVEDAGGLLVHDRRHVERIEPGQVGQLHCGQRAGRGRQQPDHAPGGGLAQQGVEVEDRPLLHPGRLDDLFHAIGCNAPQGMVGVEVVGQLVAAGGDQDVGGCAAAGRDQRRDAALPGRPQILVEAVDHQQQMPGQPLGPFARAPPQIAQARRVGVLGRLLVQQRGELAGDRGQEPRSARVERTAL
jgi:hypothetical protein